MTATQAPPHVIAGSFMRAGDCSRLWAFYNDTFVGAELAAQTAEGRLIACNDRLAGFLREGDAVKRMQLFSFFPPALAGGVGSARPVQSIMTGGRTFMLTEESCNALGWPSVLHLDLDQLGWGNGFLEVRPEVKGAGTLFERTRLSPNRLERLLEAHPELHNSYMANSSSRSRTPMLMSSRAEFMKRNVGGQNEKNGRQAVAASAVQLGKSLIKFVPVWTLVEQSPAVRANLDIVSRALAGDADQFEGTWACEIRFSPGTVRAVYFDTAESDEELAGLCSRVASDRDDLEWTLGEMIADARRHLEIVALTTAPASDGAFTWVKVGDIHETFKDEHAMHGYRNEQWAWYLAKDEVVVRRVGKFYTDMESYFGKDVGFRSRSKVDLHLHHDLFALAVLRDHLRVCTKFMIGCERLAGRSLSYRARCACSDEIRRRVISAINTSPHLHVESIGQAMDLEIRYPGLAGAADHFVFPDTQLAQLRA